MSLKIKQTRVGEIASVSYHYTPEEDTSAAIDAIGGISKDINGTSGKLNVVTGIKRDSKGHIVGVKCANIYSSGTSGGSGNPGTTCNCELVDEYDSIGLVKNGSTITTIPSDIGYSPCPIVNGVPYYQNTKDTTGVKTDVSSKLYLIGTRASNSDVSETYRNTNVYAIGARLCAPIVSANLSGTAEKVNSNTTTSTYYLCGSTSASTSASGTLVKRSTVYVNTNGSLVAPTFVGNLSGSKVTSEHVKTPTLHIASAEPFGGKIVFGDISGGDMENHDRHHTCIEEIEDDKLNFKATKFNFETPEGEGQFKVTGGPIVAPTLHLYNENVDNGNGLSGGKIVFGDIVGDNVEDHTEHYTCIEEIEDDKLNFKATKFNFETPEGEGQFKVTGGPIVAPTLHLYNENVDNGMSGGKIVFGDISGGDMENHTEHYACIEEINDNELNFKAHNFTFEIDADKYGVGRFYFSGGIITADEDKPIEGNLSGTATTANCLADKSKGSSTQPVYINASGRPVACSFTVSKSVPSDASFTDTKNTAGTTTANSTKLFLVGGAEVASSTQTYTNSNCYIGTDNCLYSGGKKVSTTDTKNTAGTTTANSTKLFLVGGAEVASSTQTYTNSNCYIGTDNCLYSGGKKVSTTDTKNTVGAATTTSKLYFIGTTTSNSADSQQSYKNVSVYVNGTALYAAGGFYESSDERLKDFSNKIDADLDKISKIKKHKFTWKDSENKNEEIGVSAQEIRELYPEIVSENEEGYLSVAYDKLAVVALAAIDELHKKNKELEARIELLESKLLN